jgi:colicin import membrane protein
MHTKTDNNFLSAMQSLLMHALLLAFLLLSTDFLSGGVRSQAGNTVTPKVDKGDIVQAVTVDEKAVLEEVARLKVAEQKNQQAIQAALDAKKQLQALKQKQENLKLQAEKERDALKALQQKKALQEKELKKLAQEKAAEQQKLAQAAAKAKQEAQEAKEAQAAAKAKQEAKERQAALAARKTLLESEKSKYMALVGSKVKQAWILPGDDVQGLVCKIEIQLLPDGSVLNTKVVKTSGNFAFDRATEAAISRASPLPVPDNSELMADFRHFIFTFDPSAG